jgi:hypothetical protein
MTSLDVIKNNHGSDQTKEKRKNVEYQIVEDTLIIKVNLKRLATLDESDLSASGKSYSLATTAGNIALSGKYSAVKLGLNCFVNKEYINGMQAIREQKELWNSEAKRINEKDTKIVCMEAQIMELKAMLQAAMKAGIK